MTMRRIFPAAKFIHPRSSTQKRPASDYEERKPLVFEEPTSAATAATKRAKGKLPDTTTRQQWHKPRTLELMTISSTTGPCRHPYCSTEASAVTTAVSTAGSSVCNHNSSSEQCDESPGCYASEKTTLEGSSRSTPATPATPATRKSGLLILAVETPAGRERPLPPEKSLGFDHELEGVGRLRIPDTPEDLEPPSDDAQTRASKLLKHFNGGSSGKSCSSESIELSPKEITIPVHEVGTSNRTCYDHERPSATTSHSTGSNTGSESLDLRAYASSSSYRETSDATTSNKLEESSATRFSNDSSRSVPSRLSNRREGLASEMGLKSPDMVRVALDGQGDDMVSSVADAKPHATKSSEPDASSFISLQQPDAVARSSPAFITSPAAAVARSSVVGTFSNAATFNSPQENPTQARAPGVSGSPNSITPPERRFEKRHQLWYKSAAGPGRGSRGRGRGRGRGGGSTGNGKWGKRRSSAPQPAQGRLLGDWRTERGEKGKPSKRSYITRTGQKLTGREAYKAAQEDKRAWAVSGGQNVVDRSTIMRTGRGVNGVESSRSAMGAEMNVHDDVLKLSTYGVPDELVTSYAARGVQRLFPWQAHCLRVDDGKALSGRNLVYSAPTSGGKTLVAEVLLLRALLQHNGTMALLVVPFIALAVEKRDYLREVWAPLQVIKVIDTLNIQAYHGSDGGGDDGGIDGVNVAVCTMEKANSIVNKLAEETRLEALSSVVVDEMHLIADGQRGFLLELMLSKLRMVCPAKVQLVCLSATLPNIDSVAKWLDASLYRTEFRPVELRHRVCKARQVYAPSRAVGTGGREGQDSHGGSGELVRVMGGDIKRIGHTSPAADPDGVIDLVKDALQRDMSVLVFCATKRWCKTTATLLANEILSERARAVALAKAEVNRNTRAKANPSSAKTKNGILPIIPSGRGGRNDRAPTHSDRESANLEASDEPRPSPSMCTQTSRETGSIYSSGGKDGADSAAGFVSAKLVVGEGARDVALHPDPHDNTRHGRDLVRDNSTLRTIGLVAKVAMSSQGHGSTIMPSELTAVRVRERLRQTPVGLDADLANLVEAGVAFHHSGLVVEERGILEDEFRQGTIRVLVATSTLAAGVNLPAHRVIIRSPNIGMGMLDSTRYHQMAGRSGRAGVSRGKERSGGDSMRAPCGESFLIIPKSDKLTIAEASKLINAPLPRLKSALKAAKGGGLERALLEVVVSKTVSTRAGAIRFISNTFLAQQVDADDLARASDSALEFLLKHNFVIVVGTTRPREREKEHGDDYGVASTQLGQATFFSGLSPMAAVDVHSSLDKACDNLFVATELHALYLLTPLEGLEPDWRRFREEYTGWRERDPARVVGKAVGIEEGVLVNAAGHTSPKYRERYFSSSRGSRREVDLQPYRRFYAALVLQQTVEEVPIRNMAKRLGIDRGTLQALQKEASVFCGMVVCFCRHLQWHELANVLHSFQERLGYSAKPELLPLVRLSRDLPPFRARALLEAGYLTPLELAGADCARVAEVFMRCLPFRSAGWHESKESYQLKQTERLAQNVIHLADKEVLRQLHERLSGASMDA